MGKGSDGRCPIGALFVFYKESFMEMKCIMVRSIGSFELTRTLLGNPMDDEVVIKVEVTGLCRTDLKLIRVGHRDLVLPRIPGANRGRIKQLNLNNVR